MFYRFSIHACLSILMVDGLALSVFPGPAPAQRGFSVLQDNLGQLVDLADIFFQVRVFSAYSENHPELTDGTSATMNREYRGPEDFLIDH